MGSFFKTFLSRYNNYNNIYHIILYAVIASCTIYLFGPMSKPETSMKIMHIYKNKSPQVICYGLHLLLIAVSFIFGFAFYSVRNVSVFTFLHRCSLTQRIRNSFLSNLYT